MNLSPSFIEWYLALTGAVTFEMYAQMVYWDLFFKAYAVPHNDQRDTASNVLRTRLRSGMISLCFPLERVFPRPPKMV